MTLRRRNFLKNSLLLSGGAMIFSLPVRADSQAVPGLPASMQQPGKPFSNYGQPSEYEKTVIRWISANAEVPGNGVSWSPLHELAGTITPNGLHFERHHNGVPEIDPKQHEFVINGLVERPLQFSVMDLLRYPMHSRICFIECGGNSNTSWRTEPVQSAAGYTHGLVSNAEWTGVPVKLLLKEAGVKSEAKWVVAEGADGASLNISIPLEKLLDDAFIALYQNGERLRPENGYPMRLILPGWEGITQVKWLRQLLLVETPAQSRDETAQYTELMPDGKAEQFSFTMQPKSIITSPSVGMVLPDNPGIYQISGLAWSGFGKVAKVEVSCDGGESWQDASLQTPVLDKAFTRFTIGWQWNGETAILQSRVTDEAGNIQPTREMLVTEKGKHNFFHYNAIISWEVDPSGEIFHVYA